MSVAFSSSTSQIPSYTYCLLHYTQYFIVWMYTACQTTRSHYCMPRMNLLDIGTDAKPGLDPPATSTPLSLFWQVTTLTLSSRKHFKWKGKGVYLIQRHLRRRARPVALYTTAEVEGQPAIANGRYCHAMYKLLYLSIRARTAPPVSVMVRTRVSFSLRILFCMCGPLR